MDAVDDLYSEDPPAAVSESPSNFLNILSESDLRNVVLAAMQKPEVQSVIADLLTEAVREKSAQIELVAQRKRDAEIAIAKEEQEEKELEHQKKEAEYQKKDTERLNEEHRLAHLQAQEMALREQSKTDAGPPCEQADDRIVAIETLAEMGFTDSELCGRVYDQYGPELDVVVAQLIQENNADF